MSHQFIFNTLRIFNFGELFINQIQLLLKDRTSQIVNAGHKSSGFGLERGVPQGDPISAYLFILGIELLTHRLRTEKSIRRIRVKGHCETYEVLTGHMFTKHHSMLEVSYADDLTLLLPRCRQSIKNVLQILNDFYKISGLGVNISKTAVCNIGINTTDTEFAKDLGITIDTHFILLGLKFSNNSEYCDQNFFHLKDVILESIKYWGKRIFSVIGRSFAMKCFILSLVTHRALVLPCPDEAWLKSLQKEINLFTFNANVCTVNYDQVSLPIAKGGFGITNVKNFWLGLKIKLLLKSRFAPDIYAALFRDELAYYGYDSLDDLTDVGPAEIIRVSTLFKNKFWKQSLHHWADLLTGFYSVSKEHFLNSPLVGNPLVTIDWTDNSPGDPLYFFGKKLSSLSSDHVRNIATLSNVRIRDVIWLQGDTLIDHLKASSEGRLEWFEICKLPKFINGLRHTWSRLRNFNELSDKLNIFDHLNNCKGTQKLRNLLEYTHLQPRDFKSTQYWQRHLPGEITELTFRKAFKIISGFDVEPKIKEHLLKIQHAISGTNKLAAQIDPTKEDYCSFCFLYEVDDDFKCDTGGLEQILFYCPIVQDFISELFAIEPLSGFDLREDAADRVIFSDIRNSSVKIVNYIHKLTNNYLRECSFLQVKPNVQGCIKRLIKWLKPVLMRQSKDSPCADIADLLIGLENMVDDTVV